MKIAYINVVKDGSTGFIIRDIINDGLKEDQVKLFFGRGRRSSNPKFVKFCPEIIFKINSLISKITGNIYGFKYFSTFCLIKEIEKFDPVIVHLHMLNGYIVNVYLLIKYLKKKNIATIITLHSENYYTGNCGTANSCDTWKMGCNGCKNHKETINSYFFDTTQSNWKKMKKSFCGWKNVGLYAVSPYVQNRAIESEIMKDLKINCILNGLNTTIFKYHQEYEKIIYLKENLKNKTIVLHISSGINDPVKGFDFFKKITQEFTDHPDYIFLLIGANKKIELQKNVINIGIVQDKKILSEYYNLANITLLTSKKETFSMIVAESMCCGTPVVGFKAGGPESIAISEYCSFVDFGDISAIKKEIVKMKDTQFDFLHMSKTAIKKYSSERMAKDYKKVYMDFIKKEKGRV